MPIVSFFDQFPEFCGVVIQSRGDDGYWDATAIGQAMTAFDGVKRPFSRWTRTDRSRRVLERLSQRTGIPVTAEGVAKNDHPSKTPLIDYDRASGGKVWVHPYVAVAYSMSLPELQADISIWVVEMSRLGTVNPHVLKWTQEEYLRGVEFNRDDITDMYG